MKTFKILSIDGGGIKGLYSSTILEHLEKKHSCHISDHFDMICGTSTGGLLALGLSLKIPAKEISDIYINHGAKIFPKRGKIIGLYKQIFSGGKFSDKPLKKVLKSVFKKRTLSESNNLLCIPSYSLTDARPWVFKFDHKEGKEGGLSRDNNTKYVDVALATSAAPTFFPLAEIKTYDNKQFVDGGVWANNPTMSGFIEALTYFVGPGKEFDKLEILSLSSLSLTGGKKIGLKRGRSFIDWNNDLFDTSLTGQSMFSHYFMSQINNINEVAIKYLRIPSVTISAEQEGLVQLDVATKQAIDFIRGKGNDMGLIYTKREDVNNFFKDKKHYSTK